MQYKVMQLLSVVFCSTYACPMLLIRESIRSVKNGNIILRYKDQNDVFSGVEKHYCICEKVCLQWPLCEET